MFVKLFTSIYQGTLRGRANELLVFTNLLAHADMQGNVDIHPNAIADEVGLTPEAVKAALLELEAIDPESRSPESEGRRILRLDDHRAWGWHIVNYIKYRTIRSEDERRIQNREAQARWREKNKPASASVSNVSQDKPMQKQMQRHILSPNGDSQNLPVIDPVIVELLPDCPYKAILALWQKHLPQLSQPRVWEGTRKTNMRNRWIQASKPSAYSPTGYKTEADGLTWWAEFFDFIGSTSLANGFESNGRTWVPDLEWVVNSTNFQKIIDGKYTK